MKMMMFKSGVREYIILTSQNLQSDECISMR